MATLDAAALRKLPDSAFAYIDSAGERHLPVNDEEHVRAAMARFNQTSFESAAAKEKAHAKIVAAAKRFGIEVKNFADPGPEDVHTPGAMQNRSPLLKRFLQRMRSHFSSKNYMTQGEMEQHYRSALGHAGGKAKAGADPMPDGADMEMCAACSAIDPADVPSPDCTCSCCEAGDTADCLCAEMVAEMEQEGENPAPQAHAAAEYPLTVESTGGEAFRLFVEAPSAFIDAPPSIPLLPRPGTYKHPSYGDIAITPERNANFVRNFQAGVYQTRVPIDAEHQTKVSGALGWLTGMRQNADGSVDGDVEWTDRGTAMLAGDRFRYVSPEWFTRWTAPDTGQEHDDILIGAALTTRPFWKEGSLRPLVASESGIRIGDDPRVFQPEPVQGTTPTGPKEGSMTESVRLTDDEIRRFREMETENATLRQAAEENKTAAEQAKQVAEAAQAEAKQAAERASALEAENRRRTFAEQARAWHGDTDEHVSFMEALPSDELREQYRKREDATAIALAEALKQASAFKPVGYAGIGTEESATKRFMEAVDTRVKDGLKYDEAFLRVAAEDPALARDYREENTNRA